MANLRMNWLDVAALVLVIVGALNWGLVALGFNLVTAVLGRGLAATVIYLLVGIAGLYTIWTTVKVGQESRHGHGVRHV